MQRLEALRALASFEATALPALTALARVTAQLTGASAAAVHLFDDDVQHRVAAVGAPLVTHPAADSLCIRVIEGERRIVCTDATLDPRLAYSSFVQGPDPVRFYASVPISSGGQVVGTLCAWDGVARELPDAAVNALEDLAIQVETQLRLLELASALGDAASRDPLTGVANRTIFDDRLAQALARRARRGTRVLVAVLDVDGFKGFNDAHGHQSGDRILRSRAEQLRAAVRAEDTVARIGGDEFALVAELEGADDPSVITDRLSTLLSASATGPSVTLGWALAEAGDDAERALRRADEAMYARKQARARP